MYMYFENKGQDLKKSIMQGYEFAHCTQSRRPTDKLKLLAYVHKNHSPNL